MDALPAQLDPRLRARAEQGAAWVRERAAKGEQVLVVHHIDADGVTSGAIAATALERAGVTYRTLAVKSMDQVHQELVRESAKSGPEGSAQSALWFCDLGSTAYMQFPDAQRLVCDHHQLVRDGSEESFPHVNPLLDGLSGEELSGAGCAYLVAAALDARNLDLLPLALVGASADLQDRPRSAPAVLGRDGILLPPAGRTSGFHGANAALLAHGVATGLLSARTDLAFFGPQTRPLRKFLAFAEPAVPTATGSQRTAEAFLLSVGIPLEDGDGERPWSRLTADEQRAVRSALVERLVATGLAERADRLWRTVVTVVREPPGPLRELQECGTLLNGTARYGRPEVGLAVARGDRGAAYEEALGLLLDHRKHLANALDALARRGVREMTAIQWTHLEDDVLDTVVGIVCGMALDGLGLRRDLALIAFAWTPDGRTKVSSRSPHELQARGIDLATAMREAAAAFGGQGGGHKGAAGATIPRGCEAGFIAQVDRAVAAQLGVRLPGTPQPAPATTPARMRSGGPQTRLVL
ncbi:MAG: DHH family phosphoesterase [Candidatus Thermoplasmatota archaeon]